MTRLMQKYSAPVIILVVILMLWEGLVAAFDIQQFLLPRPSAILSNLCQVVSLEPGSQGETLAQIESKLKAGRLFSSIATGDSPQLAAALESAALIRLPWFGSSLVVLQGRNLNPILQSAWFTLKGALGGLAMGSGSALLVALFTVRFTLMREALLPFAIAANSMPIIAFAPIANNWFGIDNPFSKMAVVAVLVFFPVMINTVRGLTSIDPRSLELMRSYASSELETLFKLRIPIALPYVFNGFKVAAALSMIGAVVSEYFGGPRIALGVYITQEAALFRFASAWAAILVACLLGIGLYLLILLAERLAMPWHVSFR